MDSYLHTSDVRGFRVLKRSKHFIKCWFTVKRRRIMSTLDTVAVLDDPFPTDCGRVYTQIWCSYSVALPSRHIVTCGHDCDVRTFVGLEDDDVSEFSLSSSKLTALVYYTTPAELEGGRGRCCCRGNG